MLFSKRKTPDPSPMPGWLKLLILGFLALAFLTYEKDDEYRKKVNSSLDNIAEEFNDKADKLNPENLKNEEEPQE